MDARKRNCGCKVHESVFQYSGDRPHFGLSIIATSVRRQLLIMELILSGLQQLIILISKRNAEAKARTVETFS